MPAAYRTEAPGSQARRGGRFLVRRAGEEVAWRVRLRARIYDAAIVHMTAAWYRAVLERQPPGCRLLDVGIGTGSALLANAAFVSVAVATLLAALLRDDFSIDYVTQVGEVTAQLVQSASSLRPEGGSPKLRTAASSSPLS